MDIGEHNRNLHEHPSLQLWARMAHAARLRARGDVVSAALLREWALDAYACATTREGAE